MAAKNIKTIRILGIDTSCDDTAISVMEITNYKSQIPNFEILSNVISSQVKLHAKYGGVYPSLAKREHIKNLPFVFRRATKNIDVKKIDYVAVTVGPGLEPCLWQGINFVKELAEKLKKPLIPVNHIEAHILANFIGRGPTSASFPAICLVVSGGHTQLILMNPVRNSPPHRPFGRASAGAISNGAKGFQYRLIGETRDDAAGECFDKTARILGLGYPGGPAISAAAEKYKIQNTLRSRAQGRGTKYKIQLPRPMMYTKDYDFSFSGLKTAVLYEFQSRSPKIRKSRQYIQEMCHEIQQSIIDVLIWKTLKAAKDFKVKSIILGGGVSANTELREQFSYKLSVIGYKLNFFVPEKIYCTDNAAMVAVTAYFHRNEASKNWQKVEANANLRT